MRYRILIMCIVTAVAAVNSAAFAADEVKPAQFEIRLLKAMPNETPLTLYLDWRNGFSGGFALAPSYNKATHDVDPSGLTYDSREQTITGAVKVTVNPDDYVPADKKPVSCRYEVKMGVQTGVVAGAHEGVCGPTARKGSIDGRVLAPTSDDGVYRLLLLHGMGRLNQMGGMNAGYALDMRLRFQIRNEKASHPIFENVVPDYRRYCAVVESIETILRGESFKATMVAVLDYGNEVKLSKDGPAVLRYETNTYVLTGFRIGDKVGGRFTDIAEGLRASDFFTGEVDREPPPAPSTAKAFLRLHGAMRGKSPIILNLSMADGGCIHGYAWASGYNHQPHAADGSKLKLNGNRLTGEVAVTMWPDCYKPIEDIVVRHTLDVTFDKGVAGGRFKGTDNGDPFEGVVTGELTSKKPPAVTMQTLGACELDLHSGAKGGHAQIALTFRDGKVDTSKVTYPGWRDPYEARLDTCDLKIAGDRLSGTIAVIVKSKDGNEAHYSYKMDAIVEGDSINGLWRGMADGKHVLNKSSKLYGKVIAATPAAAR